MDGGREVLTIQLLTSWMARDHPVLTVDRGRADDRQAIDDMLIRDMDQPLGAGSFQFDFADKDRFLFVQRLNQAIAIGIAKSTLSDESKTPFGANPIDCQK